MVSNSAEIAPVATTVFRHLRGRNGQLLLLSAVALATVLAYSAMFPLQEDLRIALRLSDNQIALLQGPAMALPLTLGSIPLALLIDRRERARLIGVFAALTWIGSVLTALAPSFATLLLARCLVGLVFPAVSMASLSFVADLYPADQRGRAYMLLSVGSVLGTPLAFAWSGSLLASYATQPGGWRWAAAWLSAPLLPAFLATTALREPVRIGVAVKNPSVGAGFVELWSYRSVIVPLLVSLTMVGLVDTAATVWAMPALSRHLTLPPQLVNPTMAMASLVSGILGPLVGGSLADASQRKGGPRRGIAALASLVLLSAPAGFFALAPDRTSAGVMLTLFMALGNAISLMGTAVATIVIPNELRALYIAVALTVASLVCVGAAPLLISVQATAMGGPQMIGRALSLNCVVISLLGAAVLIFARRNFSSTPVLPNPTRS